MTRQEAYVNHYRMWSELVEHPLWVKENTSHADYLLQDDGVLHECYLCEMHYLTTDYEDESDFCPECPLRKASGRSCAESDDGTWYDEWEHGMGDEQTSRKYATLIRDCVLPYLTPESKKALGL
jgi:hypothetical protein